MLKSHEGQTNPHYVTIDLDIPRTFPEHPQLNSPEIVSKVRNVLQTYSWYNSHIGYCQSMSYIVAMASLLFTEEEDLFCLLVRLFEKIQDYHSSGMRSARVDMKVIDSLMQKYTPKLYSHLLHHQLSGEVFCIEWFLTLFSKSFPPEFVFRCWDSLLLEGDTILFRLALSICMHLEPIILSPENENKSPMGISKIHSSSCVAVDSIMKTGFKIWNFSRSMIADLRSKGTVDIEKEDEQVNQIKQRMEKRRAKTEQKEEEEDNHETGEGTTSSSSPSDVPSTETAPNNATEGEQEKDKEQSSST